MIKSIFLTAFDLTKKNAIVLIGFFLSMVLLSFLMGLLGELLRQQIIASVVYNIFSLIVNITITIATIKLAFAIIANQTLTFDAVKPTKIEALKIIRSSFYLILLIISALFLTLGVLELLGVVDPSFAAFFEDLSKDPNHLFYY